MVSLKKSYWICLSILYLIPILIYMKAFGVGVWGTHEDWSKMGSALGGIYSPIIAFTTLLLLYRQQVFNEKSHQEKMKFDFVQMANSKGESYIALAGLQFSKLESVSKANFVSLLESYVEKESEDDRFEVLGALHYSYLPQLSSLSRAGITIHHMKSAKYDLGGQIADLRVYAASLIDIHVLLAHDCFHRAFTGDTSYYSFEPSPSESKEVEEGMRDLRNRKL